MDRRAPNIIPGLTADDARPLSPTVANHRPTRPHRSTGHRESLDHVEAARLAGLPPIITPEEWHTIAYHRVMQRRLDDFTQAGLHPSTRPIRVFTMDGSTLVPRTGSRRRSRSQRASTVAARIPVRDLSSVKPPHSPSAAQPFVPLQLPGLYDAPSGTPWTPRQEGEDEEI